MKRVLAILFLAALVTGCASVPMGDPSRDAALKTFTPAPGKAGIYIYRNETMGAAVKIDVAIDGTPIGQTAANTYLFREVAPGRRTITSKAENTETLEVDARPGALVFVWQEVKMGLLYARSKLHLVNPEVGRKGVNETKLAETR